ncbi:MAG TPA: DNA polymerase III subunit beta [Candidatus Woesebacteria bacterium]|nr:DNA polymerase III subunit beta [Candidatus Woesebacteria bacterium]
MKLSLLQENLNLALNHVSRFVAFKAQLPILGNILLTTDSGRLKLSATNLELGINYWVGAKIDKEGTIAVPAREITEFVSYLDPGKIDLTLNSNLLNLKSNKAESDFTTFSPIDFPVLSSANSKDGFEIDFSDLADPINQITFSAATDDTRPVLTGILVCFTKDNLILVATDGFRLSLKEIKLKSPIKMPSGKDRLTLLVPAKALMEINKLVSPNSLIKISIAKDERQIFFIMDNLELVSSLLEGQYPEYQKIIPESFSTTIEIDKDELTQAIKLASVFAAQSANVVKMNIKHNVVEISANAPQLGKNKITVATKINGDPIEIAFNYKFILDFIGAVKGKELVIKLNESLTPGLFADVADPTYTHIIMPVRIQG